MRTLVALILQSYVTPTPIGTPVDAILGHRTV